MTQLFGRLDPQCLSIRKKIRERYENDKDFIAAADWMTERERAQRLKDIEEQRDINYTHPDYTRKLFIIENCIFGVDIQSIATQISKLRFFISLLCDQLRTNWDAETKSYRLVSLPNLEAKFACANTLISLPKLEGELDLSTKTISDLRYRLARQRKRYFYARTYGQKKKAEADERQTRREIKAEVKRVVSTPDTHEIAKQTKMLSALEAEYEKVRSPKWVTVQKPTQGELFGETSQGELEFVRVDANAARRSEIESAMAKARKKIAVEKSKATLKPQNLVLLDRIYYLKALQTMQLGFVIGVLNSRLTNFWFEYTYGSTKVNGGFFDLNGNQIKTILLPRCEVKFEDAISNLVDRILAAKKSDPNADTSALEAEIDALVYKLYDLTPAEIDVVEGRSKGDEGRSAGNEKVKMKNGKSWKGEKKAGKSVAGKEDEGEEEVEELE